MDSTSEVEVKPDDNVRYLRTRTIILDSSGNDYPTLTEEVIEENRIDEESIDGRFEGESIGESNKEESVEESNEEKSVEESFEQTIEEEIVTETVGQENIEESMEEESVQEESNQEEGIKEKSFGKKAKTLLHSRSSAMVIYAVISLKDRKGSSSQSIKKFIETNLRINIKRFNRHINNFLRLGEDVGLLTRMSGKGARGKFKIDKEFQKTKIAKNLIKAQKALYKVSTGTANSSGSKKSQKTTSAKSRKSSKTTSRKSKKSSQPTGVVEESSASPQDIQSTQEVEESTNPNEEIESMEEDGEDNDNQEFLPLPVEMVNS